MMQARTRTEGFTLIELSIVLIIIGLIVGGVLTGQSLISAAEVRAQITQIEKYNSAVNTFRSKFNAIPGDMRPELVSQFGFMPGNVSCNGLSAGTRDGNGLIDGFPPSVGSQLVQAKGETALFWMDISSPAAGRLIDGSFPNSGGSSAIPCYGTAAFALSQTTINQYLPPAKIGHGNSVYVYETSSVNWFSVSAITSTDFGGVVGSGSNLPVIQAYRIDAKIDDGLPQSGNVTATYLNSPNTSVFSAPNTTTSGGTSSSCYDTTTGTYSITVNNGNGGNCALSFKFQ